MIKLILMKVLKMNQLIDTIYSSTMIVPYGFFGNTSCLIIGCHCKTSWLKPKHPIGKTILLPFLQNLHLLWQKYETYVCVKVIVCKTCWFQGNVWDSVSRCQNLTCLKSIFLSVLREQCFFFFFWYTPCVNQNTKPCVGSSLNFNWKSFFRNRPF